MAYDEELADRIRELLGDEPEVTEKRMFGGLAFLAAGHMAVAVSREGGLMVRVAPEATDTLLAEPHTRVFEMQGRPTAGWLRVDAEGVRELDDLAPWVWRGVGYARGLEPKG